MESANPYPRAGNHAGHGPRRSSYYSSAAPAVAPTPARAQSGALPHAMTVADLAAVRAQPAADLAGSAAKRSLHHSVTVVGNSAFDASVVENLGRSDWRGTPS
jgi:hypothetical protein